MRSRSTQAALYIRECLQRERILDSDGRLVEVRLSSEEMSELTEERAVEEFKKLFRESRGGGQ